MRPLPRPTRRGLLVLTAGVVLTGVGMAAGFTDLTRAGVFAVGLVALAWCLVLATRPRGFIVHRSSPTGRLQAGRPAPIAVGFTKAGRGGQDGLLRERHTFGGRAPSWPVSDLASIGPLEYEVTPPHRGTFVSGPMSFEAQDPLGLVSARTVNSETATWLVWPRIHPLDGSDPALREDGDDVTISAHATHAGSPGASIREYALGDDMRIVHWPATAHRGELMVRQFDPPAEPTTNLVVNGSVEDAGADPGWEWLLSAAASVASALENDGVPVSAFVGTEHKTGAGPILDALASADRCDVDLDLPAAPTLLFHHSSATAVPSAPRRSRAVAVVAGDDVADAVAACRSAGWTTHAISAPEDVAEHMSDLLAELGGRR